MVIPRPSIADSANPAAWRRPGVTYVASWVTTDLANCYQVMDCDSRTALDQWIGRWSDLVDFEVLPVITSAEAASRVP